MCYSAQIWHEFRLFERQFGAVMSIKEFVDLFWRRIGDSSIKVPKAMELAFSSPQSDGERRIKALIDQYAEQQAASWEQDLFKQRKRLADAERSLQSKVTKAAAESKRIAGDKVEWLQGKLTDLRRAEFKPADARIFPGVYAPVIVVEEGRRVVKPMRYQCRPHGKPAIYDRKFPGTYNARRDNLGGFWKDLFGASHGILVVRKFYENVTRVRSDGTAENVVLEFSPNDGENMLVACLWSRWSAPGEADLLSFAAITDEPPAEVLAAGHDRCIIPVQPENMDAWLRAEGGNKAMDEILEARARPYYAHRLAA